MYQSFPIIVTTPVIYGGEKGQSPGWKGEWLGSERLTVIPSSAY